MKNFPWLIFALVAVIEIAAAWGYNEWKYRPTLNARDAQIESLKTEVCQFYERGTPKGVDCPR